MKHPTTFPLLQQLHGYDRGTVRSDLIAGLTTAIMLVPQGMAYAMLAGLDPIVGLYASTVPLFVYALLGTSRQLAVGPVAMDSLLVASAIGPLAAGDPALAISLAALLALMVGVLQLGMGFARMGFLVKFLSHPVIAGFTSAAALIIGLSQLGQILGIPIERSPYIHQVLLQASQHITETNLATLGIASASIGLLIGLKRYAPRVPRFLVVVVLGTLSVRLFGLDHAGVAIVGEVPGGLPFPTLDFIDPSRIGELIAIAITIALVGFMESIAAAKNFARVNHYEVDADQELIALGAANALGSAFGAYPVTGGFSRTAVNAQAGAKTGIASLFTAGTIVLTLLFLTPLFHDLPKAVLAAIIMTAVFGLIAFDEVGHLWKVSRPDLGSMAITFFATLSLGIQQGIVIGVLASVAWFVWKTSRPHVARLGRVPGTNLYRNLERYPEAAIPEGIDAIRIDAPLWFANTAFLKATVLDTVDENTRDLVIDCKAIGSVDAQALSTIEEIVHTLEERDIRIWLAGVRGPVRDALDAADLMERIGSEHVVERVHEAVDQITGAAIQPRQAS